MLFKIAFWEEGGYGNHCTVVPVTCLPPIFQIQERVRNNYSDYVPGVRDGGWERLGLKVWRTEGPHPIWGLGFKRGGDRAGVDERSCKRHCKEISQATLDRVAATLAFGRTAGVPVIVLIAGRLKTVASKPCLAVAVWTQVFVNSASDLGGRLD